MSKMVFGELVIPSTRALYGDDYTECPEYIESLEWENQNIPDNIDILLVTDGPIINELFKKCIVNNNPINRLKGAGVELYNVDYNYFLVCKMTQDFTSGEVLQKIVGLINKAACVYGITSTPAPLYQGGDLSSENCTIRRLCTGNVKELYPKLQAPNLVTGVVANLLSFCVHTNRACQIFIAYLDAAPLDSVSSEPLIQLLKQLGIKFANSYLLQMQAPANNLYM